jgi:HAD superfamily hydrolase (TIGR01549 family)
MALIALDLDGTLEDSRDDMVASVLRVRASLSLPVMSGSVFRSHVNKGMPHLYEACFSEIWVRDGHDASRQRVRSAYVQDYGDHIAVNTQLYDGIANTLAMLSSLAELAVVTNKPESLSIRLLEALQIHDHFATVIGGDSASRAKPFADPLHEAVKRTGQGGPVIMIGDSPGDIACAAAFGCPVIWCAWGYAADHGARAPTYIAQQPSAIVDLVRRILHR